MNDYNIHSLEEGILKADENIKMFEGEIEKQKQTKIEYRKMIDQLKEKKLFEAEAHKHVEVTRE